MSKPFFIWTMQRTGGTSFANLLIEMSEYPQVLHEPFNKERTFGNVTKKFHEGDDITKDLDAIFKSKSNIKHCYELNQIGKEFNAQILDAVARADYKHIFLSREDEILRLTSCFLAIQTGVWGARKMHKYEDIISGKSFLKPFDIDAVIKHYLLCKDSTAYIKTILNEKNISYRTITFEDLYTGSKEARLKHIHQIFEFIEFDSKTIQAYSEETDKRIFHSSQQSASIYQYIPNYKETKRELEKIINKPEQIVELPKKIKVLKNKTTHLKNYFKKWEHIQTKVNQAKKKAKVNFTKLQEFIKMHRLTMKHSFDLKLRQNNLSNIEKNDILLFSTMKNETFRLPYFLKYYRDLGVDHFIFVNNDSNDGMMEMLKDQKDITVYYTNKSYKDSHFGVYWLNYLLSKHGSNHWCLTCDPDEFLVYPYIESQNLSDLTNYLDSHHIKSLYAPLIDMYSDTYVHETYYKPGDNPVQTCPYFDKHGYKFQGFDPNYRYRGFKGGVRQRVFNADNPNMSPALNKIPLVKWKKHYAYLSSTHMAIPRFLNENNNPNQTTGALLHFKFMDSIMDKIAIEITEKQHWDDSYEYKQYDKVLKEKKLLYDKDISIKYKDWHTLEDLGLLNRGKW